MHPYSSLHFCKDRHITGDIALQTRISRFLISTKTYVMGNHLTGIDFLMHTLNKNFRGEIKQNINIFRSALARIMYIYASPFLKMMCYSNPHYGRFE